MNPRSLRVAHLLTFGFFGVIALFALASLLTLRSLARLDRLEAALVRLDRARHDGLAAQSGIQEQYIHQAHTLIEGDESHLDHYGEKVTDVERTLARLSASCAEIGFGDEVAGIASIVHELDQAFRIHVVPLIGTGASNKLTYHHRHLESLTEKAALAIGRLNERIEREASATADEFASLLAGTRRNTFLAWFIALGFAALLSGFAIRSIGRPIERLHGAVRRAASGELDAAIEPTGPRELRDLIERFNEMTRALADSRQRIAHSARLAAIGEVAAGVAHEINNPLAVIKGYLAVISRSELPSALSADVALIAREVDRCAAIVRGLLDLSRKRSLAIREIDVRELVTELSHSGEGGTQVAIEIAAPNEPLVVAADEIALRQILDNLLRNAREAAGSGGRVVISFESEGLEVRVQVDDSGTGVEESQRGRVFSPFFTTKASGTGLGLAISENLAREHGGRIEFSRSALGGARFTLHLPRSAANKSTNRDSGLVR